MKSTLYDLSDKELNDIFQLIAQELSVRNKSSYELELQELYRIDQTALEILLRAETQCGEEFLVNISSYYNGSDKQQQLFLNDWINAAYLARTSYTISLMNKIKSLRLSQGLTQKQVADKLNISSQAYGHYENGKREPDITTLIKLSHMFNVSLDYLFDLQLQQENGFNIASNVFLQPEADFVNRLKNSGVHIYMFEDLTDEHINIISSIIKQVAKK